jgi:hypothetical protein
VYSSGRMHLTAEGWSRTVFGVVCKTAEWSTEAGHSALHFRNDLT